MLFRAQKCAKGCQIEREKLHKIVWRVQKSGFLGTSPSPEGNGKFARRPQFPPFSNFFPALFRVKIAPFF